jgi:hypothetical protein
MVARTSLTAPDARSYWDPINLSGYMMMPGNAPAEGRRVLAVTLLVALFGSRKFID